MCERLSLLAAFLGLLVWPPALPADGGCGKVKCPRCHYQCRLDVTREKETGYGWDVECQVVCVPRFNLPWQSCRAPKCAWVKTVKVLKRREYECQQCHYKWTAVPQCRCGRDVAPPAASEPAAAEPPMAEPPRRLPAPVHVAPVGVNARPAWLPWRGNEGTSNVERETSNIEHRMDGIGTGHGAAYHPSEVARSGESFVLGPRVALGLHFGLGG